MLKYWRFLLWFTAVIAIHCEYNGAIGLGWSLFRSNDFHGLREFEKSLKSARVHQMTLFLFDFIFNLPSIYFAIEKMYCAANHWNWLVLVLCRMVFVRMITVYDSIEIESKRVKDYRGLLYARTHITRTAEICVKGLRFGCFFFLPFLIFYQRFFLHHFLSFGMAGAQQRLFDNLICNYELISIILVRNSKIKSKPKQLETARFHTRCIGDFVHCCCRLCKRFFFPRLRPSLFT